MTGLVRLGALAREYDAVLCDVWGVIRDGRALIPEALDALQKYRAQGGRVVLISNSPRRSASLLTHLAQLGAGPDNWDGAVTSGDAIFEELSRRAPGPAYKLGPDYDDGLYPGTGLAFAPLGEAAFIACTGLVNDDRETPEEYRDLLTEAALRRLPMVCANPDIVVQVGDRLQYCAGALAALYETLGGTVVMAGKPHPPIYELAYQRLAALGCETEPSRLLAIGDGPDTDIAGAQGEGLDALFITSGIENARFERGFDPQAAAALLAVKDLTARYSAPALVW
ncbi:TIGR01459 family HAD-type hydrolase [Alkalicaulis satelles]|uniref:TIGR01459 family HAD-type hydrolase n=1 Tax=Alkalicaulis satelles TaxID=2609175 RepID=A0A5M6ZJH2_9PROT|nr:TIGR01459 family HAD-type hydrolase [Alkalicaulis satelles]KAA5802381.1 TIGR01459 family HAD-type hydrolase [Alkalicaulis satelles]